MKDEQTLYINLDDSGNLISTETISVYGGLVFFSKNEKDEFLTKYRSVINEIKCKYCDNKDNCNNQCPEIKNTNIKPSDKRRLMNLIKKHYVVALVIENNDVYNHIINDKAARGRFTDYAIRRMIKALLQKLIVSKSINPNKDLNLIINIDQQSTKSSGYYSLKEGLKEELKFGINNFNYSSAIKPIIFGNLVVSVSYQDSGKSFVVQAADLLAGTIRHIAIKALENGDNIYQEVSKLAQHVLILP